jgi:hypothetical protein
MQPECWTVLTSCKLQTVGVKIFSFMLHLVDQPSCAEVLFIQSATTACHHDMSNRTNIYFFEERALEVTQPNFPYRWARFYGTIWIVLYIPPVLPVWRCKDVCTVKERSCRHHVYRSMGATNGRKVGVSVSSSISQGVYFTQKVMLDIDHYLSL